MTRNSLQLDPRQRAMLEAMHIKVWQPLAPTMAAPAALEQPSAGRARASARGGLDANDAARPTPSARPTAPPLAPQTTQTTQTTQTVPATTATTTATDSGYTLQAPRLLYPGAAPAGSATEPGAGWLLVAEEDSTRSGQDPLAGEAGRLLDNMLRAMQLQNHPRLHWIEIRRNPGKAPVNVSHTPALQAALAQTAAELQPRVVLAMGWVAAQMLLQRNTPLGQLRGQVHSWNGLPLVVSFEAQHLLRAQDNKAGAWADLCLALDVADADRPLPGT